MEGFYEKSIVAVESGNSNSEENNTVIAEDGTVVTVVPEDKKIYIDENTQMDGTDLYKTTRNKEDRKDRKSEIVVDGKITIYRIISPIPMMILKQTCGMKNTKKSHSIIRIDKIG